MSRIGKQPIAVPSGVDVTIADRHVTAKGPKGTLEHDVRENRSLHGLTRTLVANMVTGVSAGFTRELEIVGVGYRAVAQGPTKLELQLGFSHPVTVDAPEGITFEVPAPTRITV